MSRAPRLPRRGPRPAEALSGAIVGVDVETACPRTGAVCAIGVAVVSGGGVRAERHWLLDPGTEFDPRFIGIHGIRPADVRGAPRLADAWGEVARFIDDSIAMLAPGPESLFGPDPAAGDGVTRLHVAHNASFDRRQIEGALGRPLPFPLACTVSMSRRAFPLLERHNLAVVSRHLGISLKHHDALSDARACALIAHHALSAGAGA